VNAESNADWLGVLRLRTVGQKKLAHVWCAKSLPLLKAFKNLEIQIGREVRWLCPLASARHLTGLPLPLSG